MQAGDRPDRRRLFRRQQLACDHGPVGLALLELLLSSDLGALRTPVFESLPGGTEEGKPGRQPEMHFRERKSSRQIERCRDHRKGHNVGTEQVEVVDEKVGEKPSRYSFNCDRMHPVKMSGKEAHQGGEEQQQDQRSQQLLNRRMDLS